MIKFIKENVLGIAAVALLVNGMSIIYMIRYTTYALIKIALTVGLLDSICSLVLLIIFAINYTRKLFRDDEES